MESLEKLGNDLRDFLKEHKNIWGEDIYVGDRGLDDIVLDGSVNFLALAKFVRRREILARIEEVKEMTPGGLSVWNEKGNLRLYSLTADLKELGE